MDGENFGLEHAAGTDAEVVGDGDHQIQITDEGGMKELIVDSDRIRKLDVVPVMEGSIGSSCGSHRSKLRLCVEMNIKGKITGREMPDDLEGCSSADVNPVKVIIDYPDDVVVSVNARIQRLDIDVSSHDEVDKDDGDEQKGWKNDVITDQNDNKILDSTFVKVPLSSTLIYPILEVEEIDTRDIGQGSACKSKGQSQMEGKDSKKSASGDASLYQTVNDGGVGFGNISAIAKMDNENHDRASQDQVSPNNVNFGKHPSQKLNSCLMLFKSDKMTPAEKLVKALHVLARYRGVWGIYEDENRIVSHLINLNRLLATTDKATVHSTCREDDYLEVRGLISYFTLEKRFLIRSELLQTFTLLSQKSGVISSFISASDIPVVLASEVASGDYTSTETYAYAQYLLQIISTTQLAEKQTEEIPEEFYGSLCAMIINAEKNHYRAIAETLFETLLHYHEQLGESDLKWQSLYSAVKANPVIMKKIKQKLTNFVLRNASQSPRESSGHKFKGILVVINDLIVCNATRDFFPDAELDIILVTLIHQLENNQLLEFDREALKTIHRILVAIKTEPSGLDKLERLVVNLIKETQQSEDYDRCYRGVLKKIYKIINIS